MGPSYGRVVPVRNFLKKKRERERGSGARSVAQRRERGRSRLLAAAVSVWGLLLAGWLVAGYCAGSSHNTHLSPSVPSSSRSRLAWGGWLSPATPRSFCGR